MGIYLIRIWWKNQLKLETQSVVPFIRTADRNEIKYSFHRENHLVDLEVFDSVSCFNQRLTAVPAITRPRSLRQLPARLQSQHC